MQAEYQTFVLLVAKGEYFIALPVCDSQLDEQRHWCELTTMDLFATHLGITL